MKEVNIDRIKLARESRGLSQTALAKQMKTASQVLLSKIEKGLSNVTDNVLDELCLILNYPKEFFYKEHDIYPLKHFYFRKNLGISVLKSRELEAEINKYSSNFIDLLDAVDIDTQIPYIDIEEQGLTPESLAIQIRELFNIPKGPIRDIVKTIEKRGVIIHIVDFPKDIKISGVSFITTIGTPFILINKNISNSRKRFTLAHELGHLIMHFKTGIISEDRDIEKEADRFASNFLVPSNEVRNDLFKLTEEKLGYLKQYWLVSMQALLYKAKDLGTISQDQHKRWSIKFSKNGWKTIEPLESTLELTTPKLLERMIKIHLDDLEYSTTELANLFGLSLPEFEQKYLKPFDGFELYLSEKNKIRRLKIKIN
ncbi:ImmA/IrrE family metallo-endopeptidase [Apibacter muscae]|uniref:ImmA/IrrE family metallo-endopeptidase n=1 Tax=Apibacter muscae TaxID=2509004 RepID=A0A563DMY8_9FLAO|nr:XRE family transcriptional regulator [Apibacter muscae]TWP31164.1 ImmA/IrrE family metallo-endopeptidase [Apibacter muscae]